MNLNIIIFFYVTILKKKLKYIALYGVCIYNRLRQDEADIRLRVTGLQPNLLE